MTNYQFFERCITEAQCKDRLCQLRWPNGFVCPKCGHDKAWKINGILYECAKCGRQTSATAGTMFQGTRKPLQIWFEAMYWVAAQENRVSIKEMQQELELDSYKTARVWLQKIRGSMTCTNQLKLSGVVEAGLYTTENKSIVAIGVELLGTTGQLGRACMKILPEVNGNTLTGFIKECMEPSGIAVTEKIPHVHKVGTQFEDWLYGSHCSAVHEMQLQAYLDEYIFRFNHRNAKDKGMLFDHMLACAMQAASAEQANNHLSEG